MENTVKIGNIEYIFDVHTIAEHHTSTDRNKYDIRDHYYYALVPKHDRDSDQPVYCVAKLGSYRQNAWNTNALPNQFDLDLEQLTDKLNSSIRLSAKQLESIVNGKFTQDKGNTGNSSNSPNAYRQREYLISKLADKTMSVLEWQIILADMVLYAGMPRTKTIKTPWKKRNVFDALCEL